jgi:hypothetical protein
MPLMCGYIDYNLIASLFQLQARTQVEVSGIARTIQT